MLDLIPATSPWLSAAPEAVSDARALLLQFDTCFEVAERRTGRVTQGVWLQSTVHTDVNVMVLDVEGSSGLERRSAPDFERQLGVLALAATDILILNVNDLLIEHTQTFDMRYK